MRSDMGKVVVERPRGQSYVPNRKFGMRLRYLPDHDYEEQPKRVGISASYRDYGYSAKWLKDLLGPLQRFLQKNLGQPWDQVYSEVCAVLDRREITGHHLIAHLKMEVQTNCFMDAKGKIRYRSGNEERRVDGFYVHPITGLLRRAWPESNRELNRRRRLAEAAETAWWLPGKGNTAYRNFRGIWYRVTWKQVFVDRRGEPGTVHDIFYKQEVKLDYGWNTVVIDKKQCNRDELKRVRYLLWERSWTNKNT